MTNLVANIDGVEVDELSGIDYCDWDLNLTDYFDFFPDNSRCRVFALDFNSNKSGNKSFILFECVSNLLQSGTVYLLLKFNTPLNYFLVNDSLDDYDFETDLVWAISSDLDPLGDFDDPYFTINCLVFRDYVTFLVRNALNALFPNTANPVS